MKTDTPETNDVFDAYSCGACGSEYIRSRMGIIESERNDLQRWKNETLIVWKKWEAVDAAIRNHPDCLVGQNVSDTALRFINERDEARARLMNIEVSEIGPREETIKQLDQAITDLNQRLIERQESFQAQLIRIEDGWREKLSEAREDAKKLRDALDDAISLIDRCSIDETPGDFHDTHKAINDVLNSTAKLLP